MTDYLELYLFRKNQKLSGIRRRHPNMPWGKNHPGFAVPYRDPLREAMEPYKASRLMRLYRDKRFFPMLKKLTVNRHGETWIDRYGDKRGFYIISRGRYRPLP